MPPETIAAPAPAAPEPAAPRDRTPLWIALGVIVLCVLGALYFGLLRHRPISEQAGASPFLLFHTPIGPIQYQLAAAGGLAAVTEPPDGPTLSADSPIRVIEAAPGSPQGAWPVIARIPSPDGGTQVAVGIAEDGAFRPIDADQSMKEGLTMHGNTLAYAAFVPLAGTRTFGPLAALAPLSTTTGSWEIRTVDLGDASDTPASLGQGSDPRFLPNGDILAYADEGVVRIDPKDGTRTVVVPRRSSFVVGLYAASPDLSRIAVSDALNSIEIYALSSDGTASSTGSIADALAPISFFGDNKLAAISEASSTLELWDVSSVPSPDRSIPLPARRFNFHAMTIKRINPLYLLPVFVFAFAAFGAPHAALAATPTLDEVFTTAYGGYALGSLFGAPALPGMSQVYAGTSYVCSSSGGTTVAAGSSGYPSSFLSYPNYYCYDGRWFYYGHQAPAPVPGNWAAGDGGYVCSGGSYFGCASIGGGLLITSADLFSVQSCTTANACGTSAGGYKNVNGGCDASAPSLPSGYGTTCSVQSSPNSCSQRNTSYGTIGCNGACSASTPAPPANPPGYGTSCQSAPNSCGMTNTGTYGCSGACSATPPSDSLCAPTASCTVSPSSGWAGKTSFTYTASASGGNGSYTYSWSGTDGLSGSGVSASKTYTTAGAKTGTVTVTSNGKPASAACTVSGGGTTVTVNSCNPTLSASPSTIDLGETTDLTWSIPSPTCASSCTFSDGHAVTGQGGTYTVTPPAPTSGSTVNYSVSCPANSSQTGQTPVTVRVPSASITASPDRVHVGDSTTISWSATNINTCSITKNGAAWTTPAGVTLTDVPADPARNVASSSPDTVSSQAIYKITCVNDSGTVVAQAAAQAIVNVIPGFEQF